MTEDFLHYLWKYSLLDQPLLLNNGERCQVIKAGTHNSHAGPDFLDARIRIGETLWAGNVEIHINASDWYHHEHQKDDAYDNVILHVVFVEDKTVRRKSGEAIPTLELSGKFDTMLLRRYQTLMENKSWVACESLINTVDRMTQNAWLDRVLVERLEKRTREIAERLEFNKGDWAETFYQVLARNFGFRVNALPMELLARSLPVNVLAKHMDQPEQIEALLFGQSGLLAGKSRDRYFVQLKSEYLFLQKKYSLEPMDQHLWRFLRLRPSNFPTIRISQFSALIFRSSHLLSKVLSIDSVTELSDLFQCSASDYWTDHYTFGKLKKGKPKRLGKSGITLILINTVIPFLFAYGQQKGKADYTDRALKFLEKLPGESNSIIQQWAKFGLNTRSAFQTQALLELKRNYCDHKRCLQCGIGARLVRSNW